MTARFLFGLLAIFVLVGCGGSTEAPKGEHPAAPAPAAPAAEAPAPPPGGDIIVSPNGISLVATGGTTTYQFDSGATSLWVPTAWAGAIQGLTFTVGGQQRVAAGGTITFPSGAKLSVTKQGTAPATWQCALSGGTLAACATQGTTTLPEQFNPSAAGTLSVQLSGTNQSVNATGDWSISIN
jgi:hypothetical protein